jgi:hypothetical protein
MIAATHETGAIGSLSSTMSTFTEDSRSLKAISSFSRVGTFTLLFSRAIMRVKFLSAHRSGDSPVVVVVPTCNRVAVRCLLQEHASCKLCLLQGYVLCKQLQHLVIRVTLRVASMCPDLANARWQLQRDKQHHGLSKNATAAHLMRAFTCGHCPFEESIFEECLKVLSFWLSGAWLAVGTKAGWRDGQIRTCNHLRMPDA